VGRACDVAGYVVGEYRADGGTTDRDTTAADQIRAAIVAGADRDVQLTDLPGRVRVRGHRDQRPVGVGQLPGQAGDQLQYRVGVGPGQQFGGDLGGGPQPPLAGRACSYQRASPITTPAAPAGDCPTISSSLGNGPTVGQSTWLHESRPDLAGTTPRLRWPRQWLLSRGCRRRVMVPAESTLLSGGATMSPGRTAPSGYCGAVNVSTAEHTDTSAYAPLFYRSVGGQLSGRW
jgi:hypothetical protein